MTFFKDVSRFLTPLLEQTVTERQSAQLQILEWIRNGGCSDSPNHYVNVRYRHVQSVDLKVAIYNCRLLVWSCCEFPAVFWNDG